MSGRHFDSTENAELRAKIDEAKRRLPLPQLLARLGLGECAKTSAHCPFPGHEDKHKSFSLFQGDDGFWHWKCHSRCGEGDEIMFLRKLKGCSLTDAMNLFLDLAGFPSDVPLSLMNILSLVSFLSLMSLLSLLSVLCLLYILCPKDKS